MICSSCKKPKKNLQTKKSALLASSSLLVCPTCIENRFEPRHLIILVGRTKGPEFVRDYIVNRRYIGDEITARELTV